VFAGAEEKKKEKRGKGEKKDGYTIVMKI